jgi:hypothetical protein
MPHRLRTLLVLLAVVAVLVAAGLVRINQRRGVWGVIRDVNRVAPEIEQHNQEVRDLASP